MTARKRLLAFQMAWDKEKHALDPLTRSLINDLYLALLELQREVQGDPDEFWWLVESSQASNRKFSEKG